MFSPMILTPRLRVRRSLSRTCPSCSSSTATSASWARSGQSREPTRTRVSFSRGSLRTGMSTVLASGCSGIRPRLSLDGAESIDGAPRWNSATSSSRHSGTKGMGRKWRQQTSQW